MTDERRAAEERARLLMMAALDGEIDPRERGELDALLRSDSALAEEWSRMGRLKEVTNAMALRKPPEEVWSRYWASVYNRSERGIGWVLVSIGAVVLLTWGIWNAVAGIVEDESLPFVLKAAILTVIAGGAVLVVSVVREKLFTGRRDPYKEVER